MLLRPLPVPALLVLVVVLTLAACERPQDVPAVAHDDTTRVEHSEVSERHFACGDQLAFSVRLASDTAFVRLPETELKLPKAPAASGTRYEADGFELHTQGSEAIFTTPDASYRDCVERDHASVWDEARERGVTFRAVGQEPGWLIEISEEGMVVETNYGEDVYEASEYVRENDSVGFTLHAVTTAADIHVEVVEEACEDVMSGEHFSASVLLRVDGESYSGCGRHLEPALAAHAE